MPALYIAERDSHDRVAWVWMKAEGARTACALRRDHMVTRLSETDEVYGASRKEIEYWLKTAGRPA